MKFVTDLHLHSKYSRAVSQQMTLPNMAHWAKLKGINVLATGDFTHPFWFERLKGELEEVGNGLYKLKSTVDSSPAYAGASAGGQFTAKDSEQTTLPRRSSTLRVSDSNEQAGERLTQEGALDVKRSALSEREIYFLLSCEISSIYSQGGKGRRIHTLFFFPTLLAVEKFNGELVKRGANLRSDGRPIVGISSRDLAEIALNCDEKVLIIPAHAWTPWFSLYGSFSGFDSIEECFGDMAEYIYGIETGLSSDPAMNWRIADLDSRAILSFSDAHSLEKMGREATVFEGEEISYDCIYDAIRLLGNRVIGSSGSQEAKPENLTTRIPDNPRSKIAFTIEFYPEEGKYHYTGHRNCNVSMSPEETKSKGEICPVCKRPLTIGVMHRVEELQARNTESEIRNVGGVRWISDPGGKRPAYVSLVPLYEILAQALGVGVGTQKVKEQYLTLVGSFGSEFKVLLAADLAEISKVAASPRIAEAIGKVRLGDITLDPGYDGIFGTVKIWQERESSLGKLSETHAQDQLNLFV